MGTLEVILQLSELFLLLYLNQYCSRSREAKPSTNKQGEWSQESGGLTSAYRTFGAPENILAHVSST